MQKENLSKEKAVNGKGGEIYGVICQRLSEQLQSDRIFIVAFDKDTARAVVEYEQRAADVPALPGSFPISHTSFKWKALTENAPFVCNDVRDSDAIDEDGKSFYILYGIRAFIAAPLIVGDQLTGCLVAANDVADSWRVRDIDLMKEASRSLEDGLYRIQLEARLQEASRREEKYRTLINSIDEGFCIAEVFYDDNGRIYDWVFLEANPAYERQLGFNPIGRRVTEWLTYIEDFWFEIYGRVLRTGQPERFENYIGALDRWFNVHASRVGDDGSRLLAVVFDDITERKRAEAVLQVSEERKTFLLKLTDALRPLSDAAEIQLRAATLLGEQLGADRAFYFEAEKEGNGYVHVVTRDYFKSSDLYSFIGRYPQTAFGSPVYEPLARGEVVIMHDVYLADELTEEEKTNYRNARIQSFVGVPLIKHDQYKGGFAVTHSTPRGWKDSEVAIIQETTERTWAAVERARAEEALRRSEEHFSLALSAGKMGSFEWNSGDQQVKLSDISSEIFGLLPGQPLVTGDQGFLLIHVEDRTHHRQLLKQASVYGEDYHTIYRIIRPGDGRMAWVEERGRGYKDGEVTRIIGVHWDVTERVLAEQKTKELLKLREEFVGNASHELKTPLASIHAYGQILEAQFEAGNDVNSAHLMRRLNLQVSRLHGLISDLLDTTRAAEGRLILVKKQFSLNELLEERAEDIQRITDKHRLVMNLQPVPVILADRERIGQVITNLLSNAIKYSPGASEIIISAIVDANEVAVSVKDHGMGIPPDATEKIFERFYRVNTPEMRGYPGMGIGLYICAAIVHAHGGKISVESSPGAGSVFTFTLPL